MMNKFYDGWALGISIGLPMGLIIGFVAFFYMASDPVM